MSNHKKYFILIFCIYLYTKTQAQERQYQSPNHYSVEIPVGFDTIPAAGFENRKKNKVTIPSMFETGFYLIKNKSYFDYPYFLIQYIPSGNDLSNAKFEDISKYINGVFANQRKNLLNNKNTNEIGAVKSFLVESITTDSTKHSILIKSIVSTTLKGETIVDQKYYVTKFGFISILGYSKEAEADKFESTFNGITNTLKVDSNYNYKEKAKRVVSPTAKWIQFLGCFILSLFVFFLIKYWGKIMTIIPK